MQVFDSLAAYQGQFRRCVATIGKYDGMHLGHQRILGQLRDLSRQHGVPSLVILSEPQPEEFFAGSQAPPRLNHFQDKVDFLADFGIDLVFRLRFNEATSQLSASDFISEILVKGLGIQALVVGDDFRFGRQRQGDFSLLQAEGLRQGYQVHQAHGLEVAGERVSSTLLRQTLAAGDCRRARGLLGRWYSIGGEVIQGRQLGRQLGVPTANLQLQVATLPMQGVFAVKVAWAGRCVDGVASLGYRPTVETTDQPSLEVHLFDFGENLYGQWLKVCFLHKLRDEMKFRDVAEMRRWILDDLASAREVLAHMQGEEC